MCRSTVSSSSLVNVYHSCYVLSAYWATGQSICTCIACYHVVTRKEHGAHVLVHAYLAQLAVTEILEFGSQFANCERQNKNKSKVSKFAEE